METIFGAKKPLGATQTVRSAWPRASDAWQWRWASALMCAGFSGLIVLGKIELADPLGFLLTGCWFAGLALAFSAGRSGSDPLGDHRERRRNLRRDVSLRRQTRQVVAALNHGLRTPLNGVMGNAQLIHQTLDDHAASCSLRQYCDNIGQAGRQLEMATVAISEYLDCSAPVLFDEVHGERLDRAMRQASSNEGAVRDPLDRPV